MKNRSRVSHVRRPDGGRMTRIGIAHSRGRDLYHQMLNATWPSFLASVAVFYLVINGLFALVYLAVGGIDNMASGSFLEAFFFSVQTFGTIGYGRMVPMSLAANAAVAAESLTGLVSVALVTGMIFTKFARPTARVLWSNVMVVQSREGVPCLVLRVANERANQIVEARFRLTVLLDEVTAEGERIRRLHDLALVRDTTPIFAFTFLAIHRLDAQSPLHQWTAERLASVNAQFFCSLMGTDETSSQTVHARHAYDRRDIRWGHGFVDILSQDEVGLVIDYTKFHSVQPEKPRVSAIG
ncbi:MAG: ion channel [Myxococcaceae bacterium]